MNYDCKHDITPNEFKVTFIHRVTGNKYKIHDNGGGYGMKELKICKENMRRCQMKDGESVSDFTDRITQERLMPNRFIPQLIEDARTRK